MSSPEVRRQKTRAPTKKQCRSEDFIKYSTQSLSRNNRRQASLVTLDQRHQRLVDQYQITLLPTAMVWDADGELCPEDFHRLLERLQAQEGNAQN